MILLDVCIFDFNMNPSYLDVLAQPPTFSSVNHKLPLMQLQD